MSRSLAMVLVLSACVADGVQQGRPDAGSSGHARVLVQLSLPRDGEPTLTAEARLLRFLDVDSESALALAGAAGPGAESLAPGQCVRFSAEAALDDALAATSPDAQVRLLDAGELVVRAGGGVERLVPHHVPEILPFVTGVAYAADGSGLSPPELRAGDEVFVSAYGGPDLGRFDVDATVPPLPHVISLGGVDPDAGLPALDTSVDLDVRWSELAERDGDAVLVSLEWADGEAVRCRAAAAGRLVVPRALVEQAVRGAGRGELVLVVERVRRVPIPARGLDSAELAVSARDVLTVK